MTTNLEWLWENNRENLVSMIAGDCDNCKFIKNCDDGDHRCDREWLMAEYVEPDTWEKIDMDALLQPREYCTKHGYPYTIEAETLKAIHLIIRCKALAGVE